MKPSEFFAVAAPGLEPVVARELHELGMRGSAQSGGVTWHGHASSLYTAVLHLRTASRVLLRVAGFQVRGFAELEQHARAIDWGAFLRQGDSVRLRVTAGRSKLYHEGAIAERILGAIARTVSVQAASPDTDDDTSDARDDRAQTFVVRIVNDRCTISIDAGGRLLHMRGYREQVGKAPLRETIAAAMLIAGDVPADRPVLDPMCGSGTIAIEAALRARRIAPGLAAASRQPRAFALQRWPAFDAGRWHEVVSRARAQILPHAPAPIVASDRDAGAVAAARANAQRAGVAGDVAIEQHALSAAALPEEAGSLVTNPPYGLRVGEQAALRDLYAALGNLARNRLHGWRLLMLAADRRLAGQLGLPLATVLETRNGGVAVELLATDIP